MNSNTNSVNYERIFNIGILDDLHNYFPDILYNTSRFETIQDLLRYIQDCTIDRFNIYDRSLSHFAQVRRGGPTTTSTTSSRQPVNSTTPPTQRPSAATSTGTRIPVQTITETIDITPLLSRPLRSTLPSLPRLTPSWNTDPWAVIQEETETISNNFLLNMLNQLVNREELMTDVVVRPSVQQIEDATTQRSATTEDEGNDTVCSICQDTYTSGQAIRTITHCNHYFHKNCIDPWFEQNVHCPVCRFDIRETTPDATPTPNS